MSGLPRLSGLVWLGLASSAAMVIGAFGPWGKAIGLVNLSVSGTDGENDGWLVVGLALVGAASLAVYARGNLITALVGYPWRVIAALGVLLAGAGGAVVAIYDRGNVTDAAEANTSTLVAFQVGWGLNLALGASVALGIIGLVALVHTPSQGEATTPATQNAKPGPSTAAENLRTESTADELERLADLQARGVLSDDEFQRAKERLLDEHG